MVKGAVSCASARQTEEMEYRVIETFGSLADSPVSRCYGIAVYRKGCKLQEVLDITTNKKQLERLVERCNREQLSLCHLYDVIEDFLGSVYGIAF